MALSPCAGAHVKGRIYTIPYGMWECMLVAGPHLPLRPPSMALGLLATLLQLDMAVA